MEEACSNVSSFCKLSDRLLFYWQGLACAQHELGIAYKQGYKGLSRDGDVARSWLTLAEQQEYGLSADVLDDPSRWQQQVMDTED